MAKALFSHLASYAFQIKSAIYDVTKGTDNPLVSDSISGVFAPPSQNHPFKLKAIAKF